MSPDTRTDLLRRFSPPKDAFSNLLQHSQFRGNLYGQVGCTVRAAPGARRRAAGPGGVESGRKKRVLTPSVGTCSRMPHCHLILAALSCVTDSANDAPDVRRDYHVRAACAGDAGPILQPPHSLPAERENLSLCDDCRRPVTPDTRKRRQPMVLRSNRVEIRSGLTSERSVQSPQTHARTVRDCPEPTHCAFACVSAGCVDALNACRAGRDLSRAAELAPWLAPSLSPCRFALQAPRLVCRPVPDYAHRRSDGRTGSD